MSSVDGGYYAIKGFSFQYDKTIIHILEMDDDSEVVEIELKEDLSDSNSIIQVKYKERATYYDSSIKKPVCQLLEMYKTDKRSPVLYSFFKDKVEGEKKLSLDDLNNIIGNCKIGGKKYYFDEKLKKDFIIKFKIVFTKRYYNQIIVLIKKIENIFDCSENEALIYYPLIYKYVVEKITNNPPEEKQNRVCTKKELIDYVKNSTKTIFEKSYIDFLGKERYLKLIKNKYFTSSNKNNWERFFLVEVGENVDINIIKDICLQIKEKYYLKKNVKSRTLITSPAPYIFLINIDKGIYKGLKNELLCEGYIFRDGFCFENADFYVYNLIEECTSQNNIEMRFINEFEHFKQAIEELSSTKKIYYFYKDKREEFDISSKIHLIEIEIVEDILQLF